MNKDASAPEHGVRFELTLASQEGDRASYRGVARSSARTYAIVVDATIARAEARIEDGEVQDADAAACLKAATALVRAATKAELAAGQPIPRKIVRWRELRLLPS